MPTLGERLQKNIEQFDQQKIAESARKDRELLLAEQQRVTAIRSKIEDLKRQITETITEGLVWKAQRLPDNWTTYRGQTLCLDDPRHRDHELWREFVEWGESEGLVLDCRYEHDGVGINSWFVLTVEAQ
jgi:hypothetical protein